MVSYDGLVLAAVAEECRRALLGGRISRVRQHSPTDFTLILRSRGADVLLFLSVDAQFPRMYLSAANPPVPPTPPNFCMLLRKYVQGSFVRLIQQADFDRVIHIHTEASDGNRNLLALEIMGKHSNLILLNDAGGILGAAKMIGPSLSRYRQVLPGREYIPPPGDKRSILSLQEDEFRQAWLETFDTATPDAASVQKWLVSAFAGFGPFLAHEIVIRAQSLAEQSIWRELGWLRETVANAEYSPVIHTDAEGRVDLVYPIHCLQISGEQHPRASICESLDAYYRSLLPRWRLDRARNQLAADIGKAAEAREATLSSLSSAIEKTGEVDRLRHWGELIVSHLKEIPRGAERAEVPDYYEANMAAVTIPLDPSLSARENAEAYFKKARKARDGAAAAAGRIGDIKQELVVLRAARHKLDSMASEEDAPALRRFLVERHALRPVGTGEAREKETAYEGYQIRKYTAADGPEILVGGNSESNDYLTTRIARPDDVWFHARSVKGAHVVVRSGKKGLSIPPAAIKQAALLAARNSDAKHSSLVPVDYTLRKYVRKPKGAAPGFVTYTHERTIDVTPGD